MPIKTVCPECDKTYTLADTMAGKSVQCKGCGLRFTVAAAANGASGIAAKPSNRKVRAVKRADDDEEAEAPKKRGGAGKALLIGGALVAVLMLFVCGGVGVGGFFLWRSSKSSSDTSTAQNDNNTGRDRAVDSTPRDNKNKVKDPNKDKATDPNKDKVKDPNKDKATDGQTKRITKANFDQLRIGMTRAQVESILGPPSLGDLDGGKNSPLSWIEATNNVSLKFRDGKVTGGVAGIDGEIYQIPGETDSSVTKVTFDKIQGGMDRNALVALLGPPTQPNGKPDKSGEQFVTDKGTALVWQNGDESITVLLNPAGKAAAWRAEFFGASFDYLSDQRYVVKNAAAVTKANYDKIVKGATTFLALIQMIGPPTSQSMPVTHPATRTTPVHITFNAKWEDGQGGEMTVHFINNVVSDKSEFRLK
jgi:hypothetical protein